MIHLITFVNWKIHVSEKGIIPLGSTVITLMISLPVDKVVEEEIHCVGGDIGGVSRI